MDSDLAVFLADTPQMDAYRHDLVWAQEYTYLNREVMSELFKRAFAQFVGRGVTYDGFVTCHHNYVSEELVDGTPMLVTRKGAISAAAGQLGIIPGSMGTGSFIVRGLGNPAGFMSASHGAGRRISRSAAKKLYTVDDLQRQTAGVVSRKDRGVVDEIPSAYKKIEDVIAAQADLVEVVTRLDQIVCVKG